MNRLSDGTKPRFRIAAKPAMPQPWYIQKITANPVKSLITAMLGFGGLLLMMIFGHLRELPELTLSSSTSMLWALSSMGMMVIAIFLLPPAIPILSIPQRVKSRRAKVGFLRAGLLPALVWMGTGMVTLCLDAPMSVPAFWTLFAGLGWIAVDAQRLNMSWQEQEVDGHPVRLPQFMLESYWGVLSWGIALMLAALLAWMIYRDDGIAVSVMFTAAIMQLMLCIISAFVVALADWKRDLTVVLMLSVATLVLPAMFSRNPTAIGVAAVRAFGLGERPARLVVSAKGCDVINKAAGQEVCRLIDRETRAVVCPAILRSRIGSPNLIELSPFGADGKWPERTNHPLIHLDSHDVLSWPRLDLSGQSAITVTSGSTAASASAPQGTVSSAPVSVASSAPPRSSHPRYVTYLDLSTASPEQAAWVKSECSVAPPAAAPASGASSP
jgi:hypothetical protein